MLKPARVLAVALLLLVAAVPATADAAKIKRGVYDCMVGLTYLEYKGSVKLMGKGRYQHGFSRKGKKLQGGQPGKYRIKGKKLKFKGGSMSETPGKILRPTAFGVYVDGEFSGVTCYRVENP